MKGNLKGTIMARQRKERVSQFLKINKVEGEFFNSSTVRSFAACAQYFRRQRRHSAAVLCVHQLIVLLLSVV